MSKPLRLNPLHHRLAWAAMLALVSMPAARAAAIVWGPVAAIAADSDVSTQGDLVVAYNFAGPATVVNGVTFNSFAIGAPQVASATEAGLYTLSIVPERPPTR